jgi:predicted Holliday junction resolvase-like endonuclease
MEPIVLLLVIVLIATFIAIAALTRLVLRERAERNRMREALRSELVRSLDAFEDELTAQLTNQTVPRRVMEHLRTRLASQSEQFAAFNERFSYDPNDARFLGSPIDFVVFDGRSGGTIEQVVFLEVKQHAGVRLTPVEQSLKHAIESGCIIWERLDLNENAGITTETVRTLAAEDLEADVSRSVRERTRTVRERLIERLSKHL